MVLSGHVLFDIVHVSLGDEGKTGVTINVTPSFGYYAIDNLRLGVSATVSAPLGALNEGSNKSFGFGLGLGYDFNSGSIVVPFAGVSLGAVFVVPPDDKTVSTFALGLAAGIRLAVNRHVSVDLGAVLSLGIGVSNFDGTVVQVSPGYLGVSAYF
jgi:Outer membrane protein beta-barrel domain